MTRPALDVARRDVGGPPNAKTILVFISSPGDCAATRAVARRTVAKLNEKPEVQQAGLYFRALLWEELPPGVVEAGDFQKRINRVMKSLGYDTYGIYVGIMKGRIGTPTPRFASGTIEEFELSLRSRQQTGTPSEILFYFLDAGLTIDPKVVAFKRGLTQRQIIYAEVTEDDFGPRLEQNLVEVARSWSLWRSVLRRNWRRVRNVAAAALLLAGIVLVATDFVSRKQIGDAVAAGNLARAAQLWNTRSVLMPISSSAARDAVNGAIKTQVLDNQAIQQQVAAFAGWHGDPILSAATRARLSTALGARAQTTIETLALGNRGQQGILLWRAAESARIWPDNADAPLDLIALLAAERMLRALAVSGVPPEAWQSVLLRPEEAEDLKRVAVRILSRTPNLNAWSDRRVRAGIPVLAGRTDVLASVAAEAVKNLDTVKYPEVSAYIAIAEPKELSSWLKQVISPDLPSHTVARIIEAVDDREKSAPIITLIDLAAAGQFPDPGPVLLDGIACPVTACAAKATQRLFAMTDGRPIPAEGREILWPALDPGRLSEQQRAQLSQVVIEMEGPDSYLPETLDALSRLGTDDSIAVLDHLVEKHSSGRMNFGFAEREVLVDHLRRHGVSEDRLALGLRILERTEEDRALLESPRVPSLGVGRFLAAPVERAYLDLLALNAPSTDEAHRKALERIIDRMAEHTASAAGDPLRVSLRNVLRKIPVPWIGALLDLKPAPLVDPSWEPIWRRRLMILSGLADGGGGPLDDIVAKVLLALPEDMDLRRAIHEKVADIAPTTARSAMRAQLEDGDLEALDTLATIGDTEGLIEYIEKHVRERHNSPDVLEKLIASTSTIEEAANRIPVLNALLQRIPEAAQWTLGTAVATGFEHPSLLTAARAVIQNPGGDNFNGAVAYLSRFAPNILWAELSTKRMVDWLATAHPFDWTTFVQEIVLPREQPPPPVVYQLAGERLVLVSLGSSDRAQVHVTAGVMPISGSRRTTSHMLALLAIETDPRVALRILAEASELVSRAESVGTIGDLKTTARAYLTWLAAYPLRSASMSCLPPGWIGTSGLDDTADSMTARAAAALILARPSMARTDVCPVGSAAPTTTKD